MVITNYNYLITLSHLNYPLIIGKNEAIRGLKRAFSSKPDGKQENEESSSSEELESEEDEVKKIIWSHLVTPGHIFYSITTTPSREGRTAR